jgi:hypothetical protein
VRIALGASWWISIQRKASLCLSSFLTAFSSVPVAVINNNNNNNNNNGYPQDPARRRYFYSGQYYPYGQGPYGSSAYYLAGDGNYYPVGQGPDPNGPYTTGQGPFYANGSPAPVANNNNNNNQQQPAPQAGESLVLCVPNEGLKQQPVA